MRKGLQACGLAAAAMLMAAAPTAQAQARESADALVTRAREAARTDRNAEAAALFERATAADPERRAELLREYADQLTYSKRSAEAVPLYRERLAASLPDEERRRTLSGLGLALAWSDRPLESRLAYEEILRTDPRNEEAQRGRARALMWAGRQREAQASLREQLAARAGDADARVMLAQSEWWLGRPDRAHASLQAVSGRDDARKLTEEMRRGLAPRTSLRAQRSTQSDDLDIDEVTLEQRWSLNAGLTTLAPRLQWVDYQPERGGRGVRVTRPAFYARHRFGNDWEANLDLAADRIRPDAAVAYTTLTYAGWLTWWPNDRHRLDFSANRVTFDNVTSLERRIVARYAGASIDFLPTDVHRFTVRANHGRYSDGNRREWAQAEAERRVLADPRAHLGLRYTHIAFDRIAGNGYFNPRRFGQWMATARLENPPSRAGERWTYGMFAAAGREREPGDSKGAWEAGMRAAYRFSDRSQLEARLQRFSSRTGSDSGFERTTAALHYVATW